MWSVEDKFWKIVHSFLLRKKWIENSIAHICFLFLREWSVGLLASLVLVNNATVNTSCIYRFVILELEL